jgi:hypothetical protein
MNVLDGADLRVLHGSRLGHREKRLAGRIRDEMQMESARGVAADHLWKTPGFMRGRQVAGAVQGA